MKHFIVSKSFLMIFFLTRLIFAEELTPFGKKFFKLVIEKTKQIVFLKLEVSKFSFIFVKNLPIFWISFPPQKYEFFYFFDVIDSKNKNKNKLGCHAIIFVSITNDNDATIEKILLFKFVCDNIKYDIF